MISGDLIFQGPKLASLRQADPKRNIKSPSIKLLNSIKFSKTPKSFINGQPQEYVSYWMVYKCEASVIKTM
jgi:hypothetical protein